MKLLNTILLILLSANLFGQNLQVHYDMGKDRKYVTSTFEMFKPDEYGATFLFIDFDYNLPVTNDASLAYLEIARYLTVPFLRDIKFTVQLNDGLVIFSNPDQQSFMKYAGHNIPQTWLTGINIPLKFANLSADLLFRFPKGSDSFQNQLTFVWFKPLFNQKIILTGFYDIWTATVNAGNKQLVHLAEPQIWYNMTKHVSIGSEIEISKRFISDDITINPTIAFKWNF
ncbi:MAG: DUF5020 family protein [FCB group bacterium]|nr:DUF5020 family protein [FCB group bacterium]